GYLACTRAKEKLTLTFSRNDAEGKSLNPSPFIAQLQNIFPALEIKEFQNEIELADAQSAIEIAPLLFKIQNLDEQLKMPMLAELKKDFGELREPNPEENLSPEIAEKLYGPVLRTSVSRLEEFAACPFRFFVRSGLKAEERKVFELDARERGSFQHDVLKNFHAQIVAEKKHWRDLTPDEARERIGKIARELTGNFRGGLLSETAQSQFAARAMMESLQDFVAVSVAWLREQNEFDPVAAELDFGSKESPQTAWKIELNGNHKLALTGRIDRVDLCRDENGGTLAVVLDYKSSQKKLDALLVAHGIQLQLLAYLNVLRHWKNPKEIFGVEKLNPAGVFYVNLRGQFQNGSREEILSGADKSRRAAYRHAGRFDASILTKLDSKNSGDQFSYRINKDGSIHKSCADILPCEEFEKLLDGVETQLRDFGNAIFSGVANVSPYKKGAQTPCEFCDYRAACRIDPWTHKFRALRIEK
ncbi:MAG: PD-(D/E)XK nuclease family protein, partial [Limisphaerales bacterium]